MVRAARDEDGPACLAIVQASWAADLRQSYDVDRWAGVLRAPATRAAARGGAAWVAEADGAVVALAAGWPDGAGFELDKLYVAPAHQGSGLAAALLATVEAHARSTGELHLWSDSRLTRAHAFYESHSFVRGALRAEDGEGGIDFAYAKPLQGTVVRLLDAGAGESALPRLTDILVACVAAGASVSFLPPLDPARAAGHWRGVVRDVATGAALLVVAWSDGELVGTVGLRCDMPENQPHRAEVVKLLVHPAARRFGIARALMTAAEAEALRRGRTLLTLDTRAGDAAEPLYRAMGWHLAGRIPGYALDADRTPSDTLLFWKCLAPN